MYFGTGSWIQVYRAHIFDVKVAVKVLTVSETSSNQGNEDEAVLKTLGDIGVDQFMSETNL
jgi:hypothetical protein